MAAIIYREFSGAEHRIEVSAGSSVMEGAVSNNVPGIDAECGGSCACATCHVYVDDAWLGRLVDPSKEEADMLEFTLNVKPNSRLSCQIKVDESLDGLIVSLPESQR